MILRSPHSLSSLSFLRFTAIPKSKPPIIFSPAIFTRNYTSSAVSAAAQTCVENSNTTSHKHHHPWPEWVAFVDRLKSQGYFSHQSSSSSSFSSSADVDAVELRYGEISFVRDPCLSFARDRYDLFRSLSNGDIQSIVEGGCPKLQRKVVNSAKRLREYVGLEEKSVCNGCSLRDSCDRAYVMLGESEGGARMVDVMRILLSYALDPVLISGAESTPSIKLAESASRRLLSMLINLSEASIGLAPYEFSKKPAYKKEQSIDFMDASLSRDVEKKKGDWTCPKCRFMNFSKNFRCRKCNEEGPKRETVDFEMKKGDWKCLKCECMNFAGRRNCFRCKDPRSPRVLNPGEWECSKCDYLNFRRNISCLKCGSARVERGIAS